jgi:hypothetical protein
MITISGMADAPHDHRQSRSFAAKNREPGYLNLNFASDPPTCPELRATFPRTLRQLSSATFS